MSDEHLMERPLQQQRVFLGRFLDVRLDTVSLPGGDSATRDYIVHPGAVMIVPILDDGRLVMERQCRYPLGSVLLEFPAGKIDAGEDRLACAQRELAEETGYHAAEWALAASMHNAPAYSTEVIEIWFARGLSGGEQHLDHLRQQHGIRRGVDAVYQHGSGRNPAAVLPDRGTVLSIGWGAQP